MQRTTHHILTGALAAVLSVLAAACQHGPRYTYTDGGTGQLAPATGKNKISVECPKCYRLLTACDSGAFEVDDERAERGVAWTCPVHGFVATTPHKDIKANTCQHGIGKAPARITDPNGTYPPAIILRCNECGAGGIVILEQKGTTSTFYCAD